MAQHSNNLHGPLALGEDTLVLLGDEAHAPFLKPRHGVPLVPRVHEALHQLMASGVHLAQVCYLLERVGKVATATASYGNLLQRAVLGLEKHHRHIWTQFLHPLRGKAPRRTCSNYGNPLLVHNAKVAKKSTSQGKSPVFHH